MSHELTEDLEDLRRTVEAFAHDVVAPVIGEHYEHPRVPVRAGPRRWVEIGLFGLPFRRSTAAWAATTSRCASPSRRSAGWTSRSRSRSRPASASARCRCSASAPRSRSRSWLPGLLAARALAAFGLTEPGAARTPGATRTTARLDGGEWVINGSKSFITNSGTDITGSSPSRRSPASATGARRSRRSSCRTARRASRSSRRTPRSAGTPRTPTRWPSTTSVSPKRTSWASGAGASRSSCRSSTRAAIAIAALSTGPPQGCVDESVPTPRSGTAFGRPDRRVPGYPVHASPTWSRGRTPRGWHGTTRRPACVAGQPFKRQAAIAKLYASDAAMDNARDATQVFGGYGFMNEYPVGRFYRDARSSRSARARPRCSACSSPRPRPLIRAGGTAALRDPERYRLRSHPSPWSSHLVLGRALDAGLEPSEVSSCGSSSATSMRCTPGSTSSARAPRSRCARCARRARAAPRRPAGARRLRDAPRGPAGPAQRGRVRPVLRPPGHAGRGPPPHRPDRPDRRGTRHAARRLAGARGRAVLPRHRRPTGGRRAATAPAHPRTRGRSTSRTTSSTSTG